MAKIGVSQNGWPVYTTTAPFVRFVVEGRGFWAANADVAVVMKDFISWFHKNIENINLTVKESPGYDDWSYAVRPVRGQTSGYSNHGSATAIDINATRHPRGVHGTYSASKRALLKKKIDSYGGVLRHGEFYTSTIDGMHVEINKNAAAVAAAAHKILSPAAKPPVAPVKPPVAASPAKPVVPTEVDDMQWNEQTKLTETDAKILGGKVGDNRGIGTMIRYAPGVERVRQEQAAQFKALTKSVAALSASLSTLNAAVAGLAKNSSADVQKAFATGIANLKTELATIDITVSLGDADE